MEAEGTQRDEGLEVWVQTRRGKVEDLANEHRAHREAIAERDERIKELEAENERYRKALVMIERYAVHQGGELQALSDIRHAARATLNFEPESEASRGN